MITTLLIPCASSTSGRNRQCLPGDQDATCRSQDSKDVENDSYRRRGEVTEVPEDEEELYAFYRYVPYGRSQRIGGTRTRQAQRLFIKMEEYMRDVVSQPEYDDVREECVVKHQDCIIWATTGDCEDNARYMQNECSASCMNCHRLLTLYEDLFSNVEIDIETGNHERLIMKTWMKVEHEVHFHLLKEDAERRKKTNRKGKKRNSAVEK